ncbi:microsomal glutathione s-transferase [Actinidia rufa]|uniref:Microsomal glutathione s-transferase n=1 Tax=Actinidia rufa TaxID=165716 RepID=A0A7J0FEJ6_9ERIC|nr:microsomal glutathione s-transferase [Actinidia rufa]
MARVELLQKENGYIVLPFALYYFLNFWMAGQVGKARKKYNVFYPSMYALELENKDAKIFNCVQVWIIRSFCLRCFGDLGFRLTKSRGDSCVERALELARDDADVLPVDDSGQD